MSDVSTGLYSTSHDNSKSARSSLAWKYLYKLRTRKPAIVVGNTVENAISINPTFTIPDARIVRHPLKKWANKIRQQIATISTNDLFEGNIVMVDKLAYLLNQSSFILSLSGNTHCAYQLCEQTIKFYHRVFSKYNDSHILCHAIQPWINMGRSSRIIGDMDRSSHQFKFLGGKKDAGSEIEHIIDQSLQHACRLNHVAYNVSKHCRIIEPLKNDLQQKKYDSIQTNLNNISQRDQISIPEILEAKIIAQFSQGNSADYRRCVEEAFQLCKLEDLATFAYRKAQCLHYFGDQNELKIYVNALFEYCVNIIDDAKCPPELVLFVYTIAKSMQAFDHQEQALDLYFKVLAHYKSLDDEPGVIYVLKSITTITIKQHERYKNKLNEHLENTDYVFLKSSHTIDDSVTNTTDALLSDIRQLFSAA